MSEQIRDYTSIYGIKDFALNDVAPKFFDMVDVNQLNVGLIGYTTELVANTTEDTMNVIASYIKEMYPNQAQLPETLYNFASTLNISNLTATPAELNMTLFLSQKDIINMGEKKEEFYEFFLDSDLVIDIEGQEFMLDYDIRITARPYDNKHIFTAQYILAFKNSLSDIKNPYIKTADVMVNDQDYLALMVRMRRVNKEEVIETLISNDKINYPVINVTYENQLANFEVFYKPPGATEYTQLAKRLFGNIPIKNPFCFYRIKDEGVIELSFTIRDNYFQPEFNSELLIHIYTTNGEEGNFEEYKGSIIGVKAKSEVYDYNNNLVLFASPQGESKYGKNMLTLEELRTLVIELRSTSGAYNVDNDLQLYFNNFEHANRNKVIFIKKRDDALERLFAGFSIFKDLNDNYYPANTLNMQLFPEQFDKYFEHSGSYILKPGKYFKYQNETTKDLLDMIDGITMKDELPVLDDEFIYTNPFLMVLQTKPNSIALYLNSLHESIVLDYIYVNDRSIAQFICNTVKVRRNAMLGEDFYTITVTLVPSTTLRQDIVNPDSREYTGRLKILCTIEDNETEYAYLELPYKEYDNLFKTYTFEGVIQTNDFVTLTEKFSALNLKDLGTNNEENKLIPIRDCVINIHALFKFDDKVIPHKYQTIPEYADYTLTNTYRTGTHRVNFITPMDIIRARVKFNPRALTPDSGDKKPFSMLFQSIPVAGAKELQNETAFYDFASLLYLQYDYLKGIMDKKTNNYGVDLKFFNTFGRSKHFTVGEGDTTQILDKVNLNLFIKVFPTIGVIEDDLIRDLKIFIKEYIEKINENYNNSFYASNMIQEIENNFPEVKYMKWMHVNNYDASVQAIENIAVDSELLTKQEKQNYVPEFLTMRTVDIRIDILRN